MYDQDRPLTEIKTCRYGPMLYLRADKYIGKSLSTYGEYCEGEAELFSQLLSRGQDVVEVGANIGAHTIRLSQLVGASGRVLAFEPQRQIFQILCANVAINEAFNVRTFHAGADATNSVLKVPFLDYGFPNSNFGGVSLTDAIEGESVPVMALDSIEMRGIRLIKIDVEGMERRVLEGARQHIARYRPFIYVENDRQAQSASLITFIQDLGYELWWHFAPLFNSNNFLGASINIFSDITSINMLCIPLEEKVDVQGFRKVRGPEDWWENR